MRPSAAEKAGNCGRRDLEHSPFVAFHELMRACDLVCKHGRSLAVTGDMLAAEPDCAYLPAALPFDSTRHAP